ncbi:DUF6194 family protein [Kineosporia succinea]|uniref:DUF6194 domain-containing protein n=1 Tax=Kineosporia succinea TaxID=84632 RepID=A0ABT9NVI4_9ACTN|nr:DUF6194 family protein [Kineosporia succinea]MDP9824438.1 hypothetical protein [Kineosporia succinea]
MIADEIIAFVRSLGDVHVQRPAPGDGTPAIAWGDTFVYYSPDGSLPRAQPFVTIVTKQYPDEPPAGLDAEGAFRVNVAAGTDEFRARLGRDPKDPAPEGETLEGRIGAHPTYSSLGWLAVRNPTPDCGVLELIRTAHTQAANRFERRTSA